MLAPTLALLQEPPTASDLAWIDLVGLGLVGLFGLLGAFRGLWWQVFRLVGLVAAVGIARAFAPRLAGRAEDWLSLAPPLAQGLSWLALFLFVLLVASLVGRLGKKTLEAMQLGLADRFGGLLAGAVTGLLLHAAFLVGLTYLAPESWVERTLRGTWSRPVLEVVTTRAPLLVDGEAAARIREFLGVAPPDDPGQAAPH